MAGFMDRLKEAAFKAGKSAQKDERAMKAARNIKDAVEAFKQGYREQREPEKHKVVCPHCQKDLVQGGAYCPHCGAKVD